MVRRSITIFYQKTLWRAAGALLVILTILTGCSQPAVQSTPTSQPALLATATVSSNNNSAVVSAAKSRLAEELKISLDSIQLVGIQPVQWPDSCLGVSQPGVMCAMHVVDGYRITLSAQNQVYEVHSNLDGSELALVPGSTPTPAALTATP